MDWNGTKRAIAKGVKRKGMEGYNNPGMNDTPKVSSGTLVNKGVKIIGDRVRYFLNQTYLYRYASYKNYKIYHFAVIIGLIP